MGVKEPYRVRQELQCGLSVGILRQTRRTDDLGVHERAGAHLQAVDLQHRADLGEQSQLARGLTQSQAGE
jgi:hypothetical protein